MVLSQLHLLVPSVVGKFYLYNDDVTQFGRESFYTSNAKAIPNNPKSWQQGVVGNVFDRSKKNFFSKARFGVLEKFRAWDVRARGVFVKHHSNAFCQKHLHPPF